MLDQHSSPVIEAKLGSRLEAATAWVAGVAGDGDMTWGAAQLWEASLLQDSTL